jgi:solute carrier family 6 (neurotransmitter transporter, glycine) member 5/9
MKNDISDGLGSLVPRLVMCLFISWLCVYISIIKGIKTSGKLSYVFAILPYFILILLLSFALTLDGASDGIKYFLIPNFKKLLEPIVWYNACSQCFYSLTIGMGCIIMFSGYNKFDHNIYRDAMIVSIMDTFTSILGGLTIFAVLGNLSHNMGVKVSEVVKDSMGLAFITYPEAIAKLKTALDNPWILPQLMAIVFFAMLFILGVGSCVGLMNNISTNLKDYFPRVKYWQFAGICSIFGFLFGMIYFTQGGIHIIDLIDHFGGQFLVFALATIELIGIVWIYGIQNVCWDVEFMLKRKLSIFWRICWGIIMPVFLIAISIYLAIQFKNPTYGNLKSYPPIALFSGWFLFLIGISQILLHSLYVRLKDKLGEWKQYLVRVNPEWGPADIKNKSDWIEFKEHKERQKEDTILKFGLSWWQEKIWVLLGKFE